MTPEEAFAEFLRALDRGTSDEHAAERFKRGFARSAAPLCDALFRVGIIAPTQTYAGVPDECDFCHRPIADSPWFVDGEGPGGAWGNYCHKCFLASGRGLGWGIGQLFSRVTYGGEVQFVCVAGDRPIPPDLEEV
jgi:hypothetical protein